MRGRLLVPLGPWPVNADGKSVTVPIRGGAETIVDVDDYGIAMARSWKLTTDGYAGAWVYVPEMRREADGRPGFFLLLHRVITRAPAQFYVDHRRGNRLDNRRRELRYATPSENSANRTALLSTKSSRYRGVTRHKQTGRWQAAAKYRDRSVYLGLHKTEDDAALAYNRKARELWGRFAVLNVVPRPASEAQAA